MTHTGVSENGVYHHLGSSNGKVMTNHHSPGARLISAKKHISDLPFQMVSFYEKKHQRVAHNYMGSPCPVIAHGMLENPPFTHEICIGIQMF